MNIDEWLRDTMRSDRYALPGWPDATARVREGIIRRRRRRTAILAVALTTVAAATIPAIILGTRTGHTPAGPAPSGGASPGELIAWLERPTTAPSPASPPVRPTARPCGVAELSRTATGQLTGAAGGRSFAIITVTNVGGARCTLDSPPPLSASSGPVPTEPGEVPFDGQTPATVDPGEEAHLQLATSVGCPGTWMRYGDLSLFSTIPVSGLILESSCAIELSRWYRTFNPAEATPAPNPYTNVDAGIDAPSTVQRGTDLVYVVTLRNRTSQQIPLSPCPVYHQGLGKDGGWFVLNCSAGALQAGSSIRLQMRLRISAGAQTGPATLTWAIEDSTSRVAVGTATVTVT